MKLNRIMIVTGDHTSRHLLATFLECLGYSCRRASKIDEAMEQLYQYPADTIIVDHHLPDMDGISLLEKLSCQKNIGDPNIVLLTSDPLNRVKDQALRHGATAVINNTSSLQHLLAAIAPVVQKK